MIGQSNRLPSRSLDLMAVGKRDGEILEQIYFTLALDPTSFIYQNKSRLNHLTVKF